MQNVNVTLTVNPDGSLTLPAFVTRGLSILPGSQIQLECPVDPTMCECSSNALFLGRCCAEPLCCGYTNHEDKVNIPAWILAQAGIPSGTELSFLAGDKALVMVAGDDELSDLAVEVAELLHELGIDPGPISVITLTQP